MSAIDHCWSRIGVSGDGTCPELAQVVHCRNCAVYMRAGRSLFAQSSPSGYLEQWAEQLAAPPQTEDPDALSIVLFRIAEQRLALPTAAFVETVEARPIHRIPHRSGSILLGMANIRGELRLCISLAALLDVEASSPLRSSAVPRLAVIGEPGEHWAFPVDEMLGVHRVVRPAPAPRSADDSSQSNGLVASRFAYDGEAVALLDAALVCARLRRAIA